jgi:DNA polymerase
MMPHADNFTFDLSRSVVFDLECCVGRWLVGFRAIDARGLPLVKIVESREQLAQALATLASKSKTMVGYNSERFDVPLIRLILAGIDPYAPAQAIIKDDRLPPALANLPKLPCDHIDLSARLRRGGRFPSLKTVAANLGRPVLRELPFDPDQVLSTSEWQEVKDYNRVDLEHTWAVLEKFAPELSAIASLSTQFNLDLRSISTPQIVERVFVQAYEKKHGRKPGSASMWNQVQYRPVAGVKRPRNMAAAEWFDKLVNHPIPLVRYGEKSKPNVPSGEFQIGNLTLRAKGGGLHSLDRPRVYYTTKRHRLVFVDAGSFYPSLIAKKQIVPAAYGDTGKEAYSSLLERRLAIKKAAKAAQDQAERERLTVQVDGLKLVLNSFFGKTGDAFSTLYDPDAFLAITLSGQLMLLDLIERLTEAGVTVLSANTDGLFLQIKRSDKNWRTVVEEWERDTELKVDIEPLKRLVILATNMYAVRDMKDRVKRKGKTLRGGLDCTHTPSALVIPDAVAQGLLFDIPPEKTIFACREAVRFCYLTRRSGKAVSMVAIAEGTETELPKVTRWYRAKGSKRDIQTRFEGGRHTTPAGAKGVEICQDLPASGLPKDLDWAWYLGEARRKIQSVPGYRHMSKKRLQGDPAATRLVQEGLTPVPKDGKRQSAGADPKHPTLLWDWGKLPTRGCYTGHLVLTLVVDIDDPVKFRRFIDQGNKPLLNDRWASLAGCLVSCHGTATAQGVREGRDRGKLIFKLAVGPDHPIAQAKKDKWLKKHGFEVFYGHGTPSILGQYDNNGDEYRLDGQLGYAQDWMVKLLSPRTKARKAKSPAMSPEVKAATLEDLPARLADLVVELDEATVGWRKKDLHSGREIWVGRCPFASEHESGQSEDADLSAGVHDDGPYIKCLHSSCSRVQEINRVLREQYRQEQAAVLETAAAAAALNPVQIGDVIQWTLDGVDQFPQPLPVRDVSADGGSCLVDGRDTPVAVEQITIVQEAKDVPEQQQPDVDGPPPSTNGPPPSASTNNRPQARPSRFLLKMPQDIRDEAEAMLMDPNLLDRIAEDIATLGVAGEKDLVQSVYLIGTSRIQDQPVSAIVQGLSASGKSYTVEKVARLFPPEVVIYATQMTPQALFHMLPGSLSHRFIVAGERSRVEDPERAEATRALREMISSGKLSKLMPVRTKGGIQTVLIEQDGPIAFIETTTLSQIFDEDANRRILFHTDERSEQTRLVLKQIASDREARRDAAKIERIIKVHHAIQRTLNKQPVLIPYASKIQEQIPVTRIEARRAFPHLLQMIETCALLHQRQRTRDSAGAIFADEKDYEVARRLLQESMSRAMGKVLSASAKRFYDRACGWSQTPDWDPSNFTVMQARKKADNEFARNTVSGWLHDLEDLGFAEETACAKGRAPATWKIIPNRVHGSDVLPDSKVIFPP